MTFFSSDIFSAISVAIATASLILSIKVYLRDMPKLRIDIENPQYDCFFGNVVTETDDGEVYERRISGVQLTLRNDSAADIEVSGITLKVNAESFRLIENNNPFWDEVYFLVYDSDEQKMVPDYNYAIPYECWGIHLPLVVKSYTSYTGYALFYSFPSNIKNQIKATLCIKTAMGICKKKVKLLEYNDSFQRQEWEEIEQEFRSTGK